jgi:phosphatidylethanolamine-binding protein (PEBP) family uncharacterized protein
VNLANEVPQQDFSLVLRLSDPDAVALSREGDRLLADLNLQIAVGRRADRAIGAAVSRDRLKRQQGVAHRADLAIGGPRPPVSNEWHVMFSLQGY